MAQKRRLAGPASPPLWGDHRRGRLCQHTPAVYGYHHQKNKKMIRYIDAFSPRVSSRTRSVTAPFDGGIVTREEYEALLARVVALEAVTRNVTPPAKPAVTRNASNAERQRRYRRRLKDRAATG